MPLDAEAEVGGAALVLAALAFTAGASCWFHRENSVKNSPTWGPFKFTAFTQNCLDRLIPDPILFQG